MSCLWIELFIFLPCPIDIKVEKKIFSIPKDFFSLNTTTPDKQLSYHLSPFFFIYEADTFVCVYVEEQLVNFFNLKKKKGGGEY